MGLGGFHFRSGFSGLVAARKIRVRGIYEVGGERISVGDETNAGGVGDGGVAVFVEVQGDGEDFVAFGVECGWIDFETTPIGVCGGDVVTL